MVEKTKGATPEGIITLWGKIGLGEKRVEKDLVRTRPREELLCSEKIGIEKA